VLPGNRHTADYFLATRWRMNPSVIRSRAGLVKREAQRAQRRALSAAVFVVIAYLANSTNCIQMMSSRAFMTCSGLIEERWA